MCTFGVNRSSPGLSISKSIDGFLKFKTAEGLSRRTVASYEYTLNRWLDNIGDRSVSEVRAADLTAYMAWLRTECKPVRFNGNHEPLSAKSIRNVWVTFRSFFGWLHVEFQYPNPAIEIPAPKIPEASGGDLYQGRHREDADSPFSFVRNGELRFRPRI